MREVEDIVSQDENIMSRETQIVQDYADVRTAVLHLFVCFVNI